MATGVSPDELMTSFRKPTVGCKPTGRLLGVREKSKVYEEV